MNSVRLDELPSGDLRVYFGALEEQISQSEEMAYVPAKSLLDEFIFPRLESAGNNAPVRGLAAWNSLSQASSFVIVGPAGSGKTAIMRRLALAQMSHARRSPFTGLVPIYLSLRSLKPGVQILASARSAFEQLAGESSSKSFIRLLESHRIVVLLDGLDEVDRDQRQRFLSELDQARSEVPTLRLGVTTRMGVGSEALEKAGFTSYAVGPWSRHEIADQLNVEWSRDSRGFGRDSYYALLSIMSDSLVSPIVSNPLFLDLLIGRARLNGAVPIAAADVVGEAIRAWLAGWDASRSVRRWSFTTLDQTTAQSWLGNVAASMCSRNAVRISEEELLRALPGVAKPEVAKEWLEFLTRQVGLLTAGDDGNVGFAHTSLRDYFAAEYLVRNVIDDEKSWNQYSRSGAWASILIFASGLVSNASRLIQRVADGTNISPLSQASLLVSMLVQRRDIEEKVANETLGKVEQVLACFPGNSKWKVTNEGSQKWESRVSFDRELSFSDRIAVLSLCRSTYQSRFGSWGPLVREKLAASKVDTCRMMAASIAHLGEFSAHSVEGDRTSTEPEAPTELDIAVVEGA